MIDCFGMHGNVASLGEQGIELTRSLPSLAVASIDLRMPDLNGVDTVAKLHTIPACTDTIFILATTYEHDGRIKASNLFSSILAKPVSAPSLAATLGEFL